MNVWVSKHKNLSSNPQRAAKTPGIVHACHPSSGIWGLVCRGRWICGCLPVSQSG